jgi:hypothetical protein
MVKVEVLTLSIIIAKCCLVRLIRVEAAVGEFNESRADG